MKPRRSLTPCRVVVLAATLALLFSPSLGLAGKRSFGITSAPAYATVEINGQPWGTTPLSTQTDDWAFTGPGRFIGWKYPNLPITVTVSLDGYAPQTLTITKGSQRPYRFRKETI